MALFKYTILKYPPDVTQLVSNPRLSNALKTHKHKTSPLPPGYSGKSLYIHVVKMTLDGFCQVQDLSDYSFLSKLAFSSVTCTSMVKEYNLT